MTSFLLPLLLTSLVSFVIMSRWYSPAGFGTIRAKAAGIKPDASKMKWMPLMFLIQFVCTIMTTRVLFIVLRLVPSAEQSLSVYLLMMLVVWIGFPLMGDISNMLREGKGWKYYVVNSGALLVQFVLTAVMYWWWMG